MCLLSYVGILIAPFAVNKDREILASSDPELTFEIMLRSDIRQDPEIWRFAHCKAS